MTTNQINSFNEEKWLHTYFGNAYVDLAKFDNIKNFLFFWSVFEYKVCGTEFMISKMFKLIVESNSLPSNKLAEYRTILDYFKNRYITDGSINNKFHQLELKRVKYNSFLRKTLMSEENNEKDILKALTLIIYRLRNNLFHGVKKTELLKSQIENFQVTNYLLSKLIEDFSQT